ncbi:MAG: ShlB/FhaC/HecB family hemolysin secretion/activation protein [Prosthecobacter sp.]|jgi:hemolysin activation/secretion protein|uniref:ShlB/FhaC/HecB family hemolysin secretion/activation protein n=1 Tax=Prosthecobacter sp. TaxID=1965333 RepID=UPI0019EF8EC5|nr:ShlB/FhaC/HecB family hemolysin secretion/activation protein [Prosthecobacter sp.]MBE2282456.1 ShlB/FhaC/HecB family hemolysin secretion/activation protein [Prosthecobacter sp.]
MAFLLGVAGPAMGQTPPAAGAEAQPVTAVSQLGSLYIREYRVRGNHILKAVDIEEAVYPFMGPGRSENDIEQARLALEKAYKAQGYQTVYVELPQQTGARGVIYFNVVEATVGRLRVNGSRYFLPSKIKERAPSMAEGTVPNFNEVTKDIMALNRWRDRKITPELKAGVVPGTVDIDLNVEDKLPLHGSLELNNQHNANTVPLRLNGSISYSNLWQLGHTMGLSFQVAPEKASDGTVYSGYYMFPVESVDGLNVMLTGALQDSSISTLGGGTVIGKGNIYGFRLMKTLPAESGFFHSLSFGMDYKDFVQDVNAAGAVVSSPITYYPFTLSYSAGKVAERSFTEFNAALVFHFSGMGDSQAQFAARRFNAKDNFFYLRGDLSHTHDLPGGLQLYTRIQGQAAPQPLINTEQIAGGGQNTVRGYLVATQLGDSGMFGSLELRSPSFIGGGPKDKENEWRVYGFIDGGKLFVNSTLPGEERTHDLASVGLGTRFRYLDHITGSLDMGLPLVTQPNAIAHDIYFFFRLGVEF